MSEVTKSVELRVINRIRRALCAAEENAQDLLARHDSNLGRDTKKNKLTAGMYEKEIEECTQLIGELSQL